MLAEALVAAGLITVLMIPLMKTTTVSLLSSVIVKSQLTEQDLNNVLIKALSEIGCGKNYNKADSTTGELTHLKFYEDADDSVGTLLLSKDELFNDSLRIVEMGFNVTEEKFIVYFKRERAQQYQTKDNQACDGSDKTGCYSIYKLLTYNEGSCSLVERSTVVREDTPPELPPEDKEEEADCTASPETGCIREATNHLGTSGACDSGNGYIGTCSYTCNDGSWSEISNNCRVNSQCNAIAEEGCIRNKTNHGGISGACDSGNGYTGTCSYTCNDGSWSEVSNNCRVNSPCNAITQDGCIRNQTSHGGISGACDSGNGYTGTCSYTCNDGSWSGANNCVSDGSCKASTEDNCVLEGKTHRSRDTFGVCESGFTGNCSYLCNYGRFTKVRNNCCLPSTNCSDHTKGDCCQTAGCDWSVDDSNCAACGEHDACSVRRSESCCGKKSECSWTSSSCIDCPNSYSCTSSARRDNESCCNKKSSCQWYNNTCRTKPVYVPPVYRPPPPVVTPPVYRPPPPVVTPPVVTPPPVVNPPPVITPPVNNGGGGGGGCGGDGDGSNCGNGDGSWVCFKSGTLITMADGTLKPIQELQTGDRVLGESGINRVLQFFIRPYNGPMYSINGSSNFVTEEHPFKTKDGWKVFNLESAKQMHPNFKFTKPLQTGDILIKENSEEEMLLTYSSQTEEIMVYNLNVDGDSTYYANGYLVHNR